MKDVYVFLELNGFKQVRDKVFDNGKCIVTIKSDYYEVFFDDGLMYSPNLQIYWLIGLLTYYGVMDKNYKQLG